jgi:LysR family transcriptional regulator, transcription activator of glutamate synthase operon
VEWLRAGEVDVAIGVPGMFDADGVSWDPLYEEDLVCAAPSDHPLSRSTRVSFEQLSQSRLVLLSADFSVRRIVDAGFRAAGLAPTVVFEGPDVATLAGLIRAGIGIGILPSDVVTRESEDGRLVVMPIAGGLSRQIAVGRIARRLEEPAVAAVSALIRDAAHRGR